MTNPARSAFDEDFYEYVSRTATPTETAAYEERLKSDEELALWACLLQSLVDGCLDAGDVAFDSAPPQASEKSRQTSVSTVAAAFSPVDDTLDAQSLGSLSQALQRTDSSPVATAWLRLTKTFGPVERQAYWNVVVDRRPLETVAERLGLSEIDVEIYVSQVSRQLARELEHL